MDLIATDRGPVSQSSGIRWLTWRRLAFIIGLAVSVAVAGASIYLSDVEGGIVAVLLGLSTWLLIVRKGIVGAIGLSLVSLVTYYFMLTAAFINFREGSGFNALLISGGLASISFLAILGSLGFLIRRERPSSFGPWVVVAVGGLMVLQALLGGGFLRNSEIGASAPITAHLVAQDVAFSETDLEAPAGDVTIGLENKDLFWHTFTIEELGVNLRVPVGADLSVTFDAPPGDYRFFCDIPGHPGAGMVGTLVID